MITPITYSIHLYANDDFDWRLNWRERCGATFDLTTYDARMTLYISDADRTVVDTLAAPAVTGKGIALGATSPNIWVHIPDTTVVYDPAPAFYILELQTPSGINPFTDSNWFRLLQGPVIWHP